MAETCGGSVGTPCTKHGLPSSTMALITSGCGRRLELAEAAAGRAAAESEAGRCAVESTAFALPLETLPFHCSAFASAFCPFPLPFLDLFTAPRRHYLALTSPPPVASSSPPSRLRRELERCQKELQDQHQLQQSRISEAGALGQAVRCRTKEMMQPLSDLPCMSSIWLRPRPGGVGGGLAEELPKR